MNKRKKVITALCIMLASSSPFGIYRLIQWDNETRQKEEEAKVREAQEAKEADEEAYKQAKEYMRDYRIEMQEQMQDYLKFHQIRYTFSRPPSGR